VYVLFTKEPISRSRNDPELPTNFMSNNKKPDTKVFFFFGDASGCLATTGIAFINKVPFNGRINNMSALINFATRGGTVLAIAGIINEFFLYDGALIYRLLWFRLGTIDFDYMT
jgi:hypothetical protein